MVDTFDQAVERLHKLYHDPSGMLTKAHVVETGVWPFAFYGALAVAPGRQRLHKLRSNAARAVVGRPTLFLPLQAFTSSQGPEVYLMAHQACHLARTARVMPTVANAVLQIASRLELYPTAHGPGSALQLMFRRLDWVIRSDGLFKGPGHVEFNVFTSSSSEIKKAIQAAWAVEVQKSVQDRSGLDRFPLPSRSITQQLFQQFQPWEQVILSRHVTGAFLSNAEKSTWSRVVGEACDLCGQCDTKHHRLFTCPAMADVRQDHSEIVSQVQREFPWWSHMLAASEPDEVPMLRLIMANRKLPPTLPPPIGCNKVYLFTDGSAHNTSYPDARLTYWSVVWCHGVSDEAEISAWASLPLAARVATFRVLAQGSTPKAQTVPRAELAAVIWAAQWAAQRDDLQAVLFTDSQFAMDTWRKAKARPQADSGLAHTDLLQQFPPNDRIELRKVKSHNPAGLAPSASAYLQWTTMGNEMADRAAGLAKRGEMDLVVQASDSIAESTMFQLDHLLSFSRYLVDLNVAEIERKSQLQELPQVTFAPQDIEEAVRTYYLDWDVYTLEEGISPSVPSNAQELLNGQPAEIEYDHLLLQWLQSLQWPSRPQQDEFPKDVTFLELFVCFTMVAGVLPPHMIQDGEHYKWVPAAAPEGQQLPCTSMGTIFRFRDRIHRMEKLFGRDLLLAQEKSGIGRLAPLGAEGRLLGLDARPLLNDPHLWLPTVMQWLRSFQNGSFMHAALARRNTAADR